MSYRGETNSKKIARALMWGALANEDFDTSDGGHAPVIYVSGPEAHDAVAASGWGIKRDRLIGLDMCTDAVRSARAAHPWACVDQGDVFEAVRQYRPATAFLDMCTLLVDTVPDAINAVIDAWEMDGADSVYQCAICVGGVYGHSERAMHSQRARRIHHMDAPNKRVRRSFRLASDAAVKRGCIAMPMQAIQYQSADKESNGSPMLYVSWLVACDPAIRRWARMSGMRVRKFTMTMLKATQAGIRAREQTHTRCGDADWSGLSVLKLRGDKSGAKLRRAACAFAEHVGTDVAARCFCIPRGTLSAWMAHRTRGTYDEQPDPSVMEAVERCALIWNDLRINWGWDEEAA